MVWIAFGKYKYKYTSIAIKICTYIPMNIEKCQGNGHLSSFFNFKLEKLKYIDKLAKVRSAGVIDYKIPGSLAIIFVYVPD